MENKISLSSYLRDKRKEAGLSQAKVASVLGYTTAQFISNWERGLSEPPFAALKILADLYNVSMEEMFDVVLKSTIHKVTADLKFKFYKTE